MSSLSDDGYSEIEQIFKEIEAEEETYWNSLTKEQQLLAFCAVVRRLTVGELVQKKTYRGILYDVFEFDFDSYVRAQNAGFLELHNAIDPK